MDTNDKALPTEEDFSYQDHILQGVSRTFALTIPQLPDGLASVVSNAYLLCRIADTIEDDAGMPYKEKEHFASRFIQVVANTQAAESFAEYLFPLLSESTSESEKDLVKHSAKVIRITHSYNPRQRQALEICIQLMSEGMARYQEADVSNGLKDQPDMDSYCYYVAGVVGEMLTELFCDYSEEINEHHAELKVLAVSFGQGLQMTNILKDIWEDQSRKMCWLPGDVFEKHSVSLTSLAEHRHLPGFELAMQELLGLAHAHLNNALRYTLLIPSHEKGIRRFCLWAIGMAVLTLRKIHNNPEFRAGKQVKISRNSVKATIALTSMCTKQDALLRVLFRLTAFGLPLTKLADKFEPDINTQ